MSALTDPSGFKLSTLVETQRGLTEAEVHNFLLTGQLPDLSLPPDEPDLTPELPTTQVIALSQAEAWLAGRFPGLTAGFNPNQPRDSEGKWSKIPGVSIPGPDKQRFRKLIATDADVMHSEMQSKKSWTTAQIKALRDYASDGHKKANPALRGMGTADAKTKKLIADARAGMRPASRDIVVFRGTWPAQFGIETSMLDQGWKDEFKSHVGEVFHDPAFASTSTSAFSAFKTGLTVEIEVPKGTPLAYIASISANPSEREVVLAPDLHYQLLSFESTMTGPVARMRVVPPPPKNEDVGEIALDVPAGQPVPDEVLPNAVAAPDPTPTPTLEVVSGKAGQKVAGSGGKKITPAVIYKKHTDGAIVAEAPNRRMRWNAGAKKFVVEEKKVVAAPFAAPTTRKTAPTSQWAFSYEAEPDVQVEYGSLAKMSDEDYEKAGYHLITLPVSALVPTQEDDQMEWGDADEYGATGKPFVVDLDGELFLIDGHHRANKAGPHGQIQAWVTPVESNEIASWQETSRLAKTAAYEDVKVPGRWFEPGSTDAAEPSVSPETPQPVSTEAAPTAETNGIKHVDVAQFGDPLYRDAGALSGADLQSLPLTHTTKNPDALRAEGFDPKKGSGHGQLLGTGTYVALDQATATLYQDKDTTTLPVKIDPAARLLSVSGNDEYAILRRAAELLPGGEDRWHALSAKWKTKGHPEPEAAALRQIALKEGWDGLVARTPHTADKQIYGYAGGGNQVVVWTPDKVHLNEVSDTPPTPASASTPAESTLIISEPWAQIPPGSNARYSVPAHDIAPTLQKIKMSSDFTERAQRINQIFANRYGASFASVEHSSAYGKEEPSTKTEKNMIAYVRSRAGVMTLGLNPKVTASMLTKNEKTGHWPPGSGHVEGLLTHEFAHALLQGEGMSSLWPRDSTSLGKALRLAKAAAKDAGMPAPKQGIGMGAVSDYAHKNNREAEAELFSAYHFSGDKRALWVVAWGETLHRELGLDPTPISEDIKGQP